MHTDHLGTPQAVTDQNQLLVWRARYSPFGNAILETAAITNPLRFPGQYYDEETGLHYNYFRYYDPESGRYVTSDPIGLDGGMNLYLYVNNAPTMFADPLGLAPTGPGGGSGGSGSQGQQCNGDDCKQTYLDCLANCIRTYDPLGDGGKAGLTAAGGTFPKSAVGLPRGLGGASPMTTVPSAAAHGLGGGGAGTLGGVARGVGRFFSLLWIGYGLYLFGMEGYCAAACANNRCAY